MMIQFSMMLILPLYFQTAAGLSPLQTEFSYASRRRNAWLVTAMVGGRLFDKIGFKPAFNGLSPFNNYLKFVHYLFQAEQARRLQPSYTQPLQLA